MLNLLGDPHVNKTWAPLPEAGRLGRERDAVFSPKIGQNNGKHSAK